MSYYDSYYEEYIPPECPRCEDRDYKIDQATYYLRQLAHEIYYGKSENTNKLQECLDELMSIFKITIPEETIRFCVKKEAKLVELLPAWVRINNEYLASLIK